MNSIITTYSLLKRLVTHDYNHHFKIYCIPSGKPTWPWKITHDECEIHLQMFHVHPFPLLCLFTGM